MARRKHKHPPTPAPEPSSRHERFAGLFMSAAAAIGFAAAGVMALWDHAVTLPGRDGPVRSSGAAADIVGWVLLAGAAAFASHLAMLLKPGKAGVRWMVCIFLVWAAAAAAYYATRRL